MLDSRVHVLRLASTTLELEREGAVKVAREPGQVTERNSSPSRLHGWLAARPADAERLQLFWLPGLDQPPVLVQEWTVAEFADRELFDTAKMIHDVAHAETDQQGVACRFGVRFIAADGVSRGQTTLRCAPTRNATREPAETPFNFSDELDASVTGTLAVTLRHSENMHRQTLIAQNEANRANRDAMALAIQTNGQLSSTLNFVAGEYRQLSSLMREVLSTRAHSSGGAGEDDPIKQAHAVGIETAYRAISDHVIPRLPDAAKAVAEKFTRTPTGQSRGGRNYQKKGAIALASNAPAAAPAAPAAPSAAPNGNGKGPTH